MNRGPDVGPRGTGKDKEVGSQNLTISPCAPQTKRSPLYGANTEVAKTSAALPADYEPDKGLKKLAVAEAAENYYARAKDATGLYEAIAAKLGEQRKFVLWWDGQEKNPGSRKGAAITDQLRPKLEDYGVEPMTVSRWRMRLKSDDNFAAQIVKAHERCIKVCETPSVLYPRAVNSGNNEWYTPAEYVEAARDVLKEIDLDPASSEAAQKTVKAANFFTAEDDGLTQDWFGRVWLNPPYAQPLITNFIEKLVAEWGQGKISAAILLTHNYTDTKFFHHAAAACAAICFTRGRITFSDTKGNRCSPTQGQAFFYFGNDAKGFAARFGEVGFVVQPWRRTDG